MMAEVLGLTFSEPLVEVTRRTGRVFALAGGISLQAVQRIRDVRHLKLTNWHELKRLRSTFPPQRSEVLVGLRRDQPTHAVMLPNDEKSRIRTLEQTYPDRPFAPATPPPGPMTTPITAKMTLFGALVVPAGTVLGRCIQRHRTGEFVYFLADAEATVPPA